MIMTRDRHSNRLETGQQQQRRRRRQRQQQQQRTIVTVRVSSPFAASRMASSGRSRVTPALHGGGLASHFTETVVSACGGRQREAASWRPLEPVYERVRRGQVELVAANEHGLRGLPVAVENKDKYLKCQVCAPAAVSIVARSTVCKTAVSVFSISDQQFVSGG
jgi:hypothetical protein